MTNILIRDVSDEALAAIDAKATRARSTSGGPSSVNVSRVPGP